MSAAPSVYPAEVAALFGTATMPDKPADHIVFSEIRLDKRYDIEGVCSFIITRYHLTQESKVNKNFLQWYKTDRITMTPAEGIAVTGLEFVCTDAAYCFSLGASAGKCSVDAATLTSSWQGKEAAPFVLTASFGQLRVPYLRISYTEDDGAGIGSLNEDNGNLPVEYYNLNGVRIDRPIPGQICIRRQGATVTKIISN